MSQTSPIRYALAAPAFSESDVNAVARVLRSGTLVQGPEVRAFETLFERFTGARHAIAVANGTVAIELALEVCGVGPDDEVIVPAFSFVATANAVALRGATPVFVDIDLRTFNIEVAQIAHAITPRTKAILPVHEFGLCCDIDPILDLARSTGLAVIEDAACALGSLRGGRHAGTFGDIGTFSLHPRKIVTCGEGGVLTTDSDVLAERIRILRNHGASGASQPAAFVAVGRNARLTDFQAALAAAQMPRLPESLAHRQRLAALYRQHITHPDLSLPFVPPGCEPNWQTFHLLLSDRLDQADVIARLREHGVGTNLGAQCIPAQASYAGHSGDERATRFPQAWRAWKKGLAIPLHEKISLADAAHIAEALNQLPTS